MFMYINYINHTWIYILSQRFYERRSSVCPREMTRGDFSHSTRMKRVDTRGGDCCGTREEEWKGRVTRLGGIDKLIYDRAHDVETLASKEYSRS